MGDIHLHLYDIYIYSVYIHITVARIVPCTHRYLNTPNLYPITHPILSLHPIPSHLSSPSRWLKINAPESNVILSADRTASYPFSLLFFPSHFYPFLLSFFFSCLFFLLSLSLPFFPAFSILSCSLSLVLSHLFSSPPSSTLYSVLLDFCPPPLRLLPCFSLQ